MTAKHQSRNPGNPDHPENAASRTAGTPASSRIRPRRAATPDRLETLEPRVLLSLAKSSILPFPGGGGGGGGYFPGQNEMTTLGNAAYFTVATPEQGRELWRTDGTAAGTALVSDINPGSAGADPGQLTAAGNLLYFTADDGSHGVELYTSDGTSAGTKMVADVQPGVMASFPTILGVLNGTVYFAAEDGSHGWELWSTRGDAASTQMVGDLVPGAEGSFPGNAAVAGNRLFFTAQDPNGGQELYVLDQPGAAPRVVHDLNVNGTPLFPNMLTAVGNDVYFLTYSPDAIGAQLWTSDGTTEGTKVVENAVPANSYPTQLAAVGNQLFISTDGESGAAIRTIAAKGSPVADVQTFSNANGPVTVHSLVGLGDKLSFVVASQDAPPQLWRSDGTVEGTGQIAVIGTGEIDPNDPSLTKNYGYITAMTVAGGKLSFVYGHMNGGIDLYQSDGTANGTRLITTIKNDGTAGAMSPWIGDYGALTVNGVTQSIIIAHNGTDSKARLQTYAGGSADASTLTTLREFDEGGIPTSMPNTFTSAGNQVFFTAYDPEHGQELWVTGGTAATTRMVKDVQAGKGSSYPSGITAWGSKVLFSADDGAHGTELWVSDGTSAGTKMLGDLAKDGESSYPYGFHTVGNTVYFVATNSAHGSELWRTDGVTLGALPVKELAAGAAGSYPSDLTTAGSQLFFTATDANGERSLFRTDGASAGTIQLTKGGPAESAVNYPSQLTAIGNILYFTASTGKQGTELFRSDGTIAGTKLVADVVVGQNSGYPQNLTKFGNALYFTAGGVDGDTGVKLYRSDGTAKGTTELFAPASVSSRKIVSIQELAATDDALYFVTSDDQGAPQMWRTDGTIAGTLTVPGLPTPTIKDGFANPWVGVYGLKAVGQQLYFTVDDGVSGGELWTVTHNGAGAVRVTDINPGAKGANPMGYASVNNGVVFSADDGVHGQELWFAPKSDGQASMVLDINTVSNPPMPMYYAMDMLKGGPAVNAPMPGMPGPRGGQPPVMNIGSGSGNGEITIPEGDTVKHPTRDAAATAPVNGPGVRPIGAPGQAPIGANNNRAFLRPGAPAGAKILPATGELTWTAPDGPATQNFQWDLLGNTPANAAPNAGLQSLKVNVTNVAPKVDAGSDANLAVPGTLQRAGNFADPGADTWTATVDYGTGAGPTPLTLQADKTFALNQAYAKAGTYNVTVAVKDKDGGVGQDMFQVNVAAGTGVVNATFRGLPRPGVLVTLPANAQVQTSAFVVRNPQGRIVPIRTTITAGSDKTTANLNFGRGRGGFPAGEYSLTVRSSRVLDAAGKEIDGNGDGAPGGDFTANTTLTNPNPRTPRGPAGFRGLI